MQSATIAKIAADKAQPYVKPTDRYISAQESKLGMANARELIGKTVDFCSQPPEGSATSIERGCFRTK
jgi:hypothetical protein